MGSLSSEFTREEIETLIESMSDWESLGNREWFVMDMVKKAVLPSEDDPAYEEWSNIKDHFKKRERDIEADKFMRQEKSVFIKAKLMLVRKDMEIDQLFSLAAAPSVRPVEGDPASRLAEAEAFMKEIGEGFWEHYQQFLADKRQNPRKEE